MTKLPSGATSYKSTSQGILPRHEVVKLEIEGVKRGLEWIYEQVKAGKKITINPKQIQDLHRLCFGWIFPDWAGKYRTIQVIYSGKETPSYLFNIKCVD